MAKWEQSQLMQSTGQGQMSAYLARRVELLLEREHDMFFTQHNYESRQDMLLLIPTEWLSIIFMTHRLRVLLHIHILFKSTAVK